MEIELPTIPLLGIHTKETRIERDMCTPMFTAALFTIARTWKLLPRCSLTDEWIKKLWYMYTTEYYSAIKDHIWLNSNEVDELRDYYIEWSKSEREKQVSRINAYIWNLERCHWWTYLQGSNGDTDIEKRLVDTGEGGAESATNGDSSMETHTLPYVK